MSSSGAVRGIRAVALDVDGVLTEDGFWWSSEGEQELKRFSFLDVMGISLARRAGLVVALISGEDSLLLDRYAAKLGIKHVHRGCRDKAEALTRFSRDTEVPLANLCFIGNDINDLGAMRACGLSACPSDAHPSVRAIAQRVSSLPGGRGAVREILDEILGARAEVSQVPQVSRVPQTLQAPEVAQSPGPVAELLRRQLAEHEGVMRATLRDLSPSVEALTDALCECFARGGKVMFCGNGGSAADCQHFAAEFVNRLRFDRPALAALALTVDSSVLSAIANDSAYEQIFARQVEALGRRGDFLVAISTSGRSPNVLRGLERARALGLRTAGLCGAGEPCPMRSGCDMVLAVPSIDTARIQEAHEFILHVVAEAVEARLFGA